ncbi:MAG: hypothetical protein E7510_03215 [Ruminococcus sp.]|nr:hypothetical protein [Ruminococcus sp.]
MNEYAKARKAIISELVEFKLTHLDIDTKDLLINNNWGLTLDEFDQCEYPLELKEELLNEYSPKHEITSDFYDPLIRAVISVELNEYTNSELERLYYKLFGYSVDVKGEEKNTRLYNCPCCHNSTLDERGQYYICPICDWEDDGLDYDHISHCNGMRLSIAQKKFKEYGSIYYEED